MRRLGWLSCALALLLSGCDDGSDSAARTGRLVSADITVPYANAVTALQTYRQRGAPDVALVTLEGVDHVGGISAAIGPTLDWFRSLRR